MIFGKKGLASTALLLIISVPLYADVSPATSSQTTTGGLRIQLDKAGNITQPVPSEISDTLPAHTGKTTGNVPVVVTPPVALSKSAGASVAKDPGNVATAPEQNNKSGKVVRLNGLFHAASRASINATGQLESDCHVGANGENHEGHRK